MKLSAFLMVFTISSSIAQTKSIFEKRFATGFCLTNSLGIDKHTSNFGAAPESWIRHSKLDKVKLINDSTAVMITSATCVETYSERQEKWIQAVTPSSTTPYFLQRLRWIL